jgi:hypothetical protein
MLDAGEAFAILEAVSFLVLVVPAHVMAVLNAPPCEIKSTTIRIDNQDAH